jgi:hypothetical protein
MLDPNIIAMKHFGNTLTQVKIPETPIYSMGLKMDLRSEFFILRKIEESGD